MRSTRHQRQRDQGLLFDTLSERGGQSSAHTRGNSSGKIDLPAGKRVAIDIETDGLDPYHGARMFCFSYFTELGEYGFFLKSEASLDWLQRLYQCGDRLVIGHNLKFDLIVLSFDGVNPRTAKCQFHDTMIMAKVMNSLLPNYDLLWLATYFVGRSKQGKNEVTQWLQKNRKSFISEHDRPPNFSDAPIELVKVRNLWDTESTLLLFHFLERRVMKASPELYETERQLLLEVIDMELTGVQIDITHAKRLRREAKRWMKIIQRDLNALVCPLTIQRTKKRKRKGEVYLEPYEEVLDEFNANSSAIQLPAAFEKLGIELRYKTIPKKKKDGSYSGGGNWAFDEYAMIRYVSKPLAGIIRDSSEEGWSGQKFYDAVHQVVAEHKLDRKELIAPLVLKVRELQKMVNTYYNHLIDQCVDVRVFPNGREVGILHCRFNQTEARTGRFSSSDPNLQNIPRLLGPRECFMPRTGRRNWHFDYEQVEMKFFCHFAKDPDMASAVADDIHRYVASQIYGVSIGEVSSERRKRAKAINFGILYGAKPPKVAQTLTQKGLPTTELESSLLCSKYHRRFPSIVRTTNEFATSLAVHGFVANPFGRRYYIPPKQAYKMLNYMCQGTSADLIKNRIVAIAKHLRTVGSRAKLLMQVHDELVIEIPKCEEKTLVPTIKRLMEDPTSYFVPITVDAEVSVRRWSHKLAPADVGLAIN